MGRMDADAGEFAELGDGNIPQMGGKLIALLDPRNHSYTHISEEPAPVVFWGYRSSRHKGMCPPRAMFPLLEQAVVPGTLETRVYVGLLLSTDLTTGLRSDKGGALRREYRQSTDVESEPSHLLESTYRCMRLFTKDLPKVG